jgi:hypothetical protein
MEAQMRSQMEAQLEAQAKQMADLIAFMASEGMQVPATLLAPPPPSQNADATPVSIDFSVFRFCICLSDIDVYFLQPPSVGSNNPQAPGSNTPGGQGGTTSPGWPGQGWP